MTLEKAVRVLNEHGYADTEWEIFNPNGEVRGATDIHKSPSFTFAEFVAIAIAEKLEHDGRVCSKCQILELIWKEIDNLPDEYKIRFAKTKLLGM